MAQGSTNSGTTDSAIISTGTAGRKEAKNLIDAISEMQNFSVGEQKGLDVSENYFTWQMSIEFFAVGFKSLMPGFLICLFCIPLAVAISMGVVPVYGGMPSLYDKVYMFIVALAVSITATLILFTAAKYVEGTTTFQMAKSMYGGAMVSVLVKGVVLFVVFQLIAVFISPDFVYNYLNEFLDFLLTNPEHYSTPDLVTLILKPMFRISSVVILIYAVVTALLLGIAWLKMRSKYREKTRVADYMEKGDA